MQTPLTLSKTSPRKCRLRRKLRQAEQKIKKLEVMLKKKDAEINMDLLDIAVGKFFPPATADFIKQQACLFQVNDKGRRYNSVFKQYCLSLYFSSPKAYKDLAASKLFCLPHPITLKRFTNTIYLTPGIQNVAFQILKIKIETLKEIDKYCILCLDEMSLKAYLFYNSTRDKVIGFEDVGLDNMYTEQLLPACNVAVILVRGICKSWKQPLAYFFTNSTLNSSKLLNILHEAIIGLRNIGLKVLCVISDMGSNFVKLSELLHISSKKPYFEINNEKIFYMFDVPHLVKATRNNLLRHSYVDEDKVTSWQYINILYNDDKSKQCRIAPRLTDAHVTPNNFQRMKVKYATQILSATVSAALNTYISLGILPAKAAFTAEFIERFNKLFDILNVSMLYNSNPNKKAFTNSDEQHLFLNETLSFLQRVKVISSTKKDITRSITSIKCWIITITSLLQLWKELEQSQSPIKFLFTRRFNQDALENFFGAVRAQNGNAFNPTPIQFYHSFKKLFCINYCQVDTGNCEIDTDEILLQSTNFQEMDLLTIQTAIDNNNNTSINIEIDNYEYRNMPISEENAFTYICGYLLKRCFAKHMCEACERILSEKNSDLNILKLYSYFRAYDNTENTFGSLHIPSSLFLQYIKEMHVKFFENFSIIKKSNVVQNFTKIISEIEFSHSCPNFPKNYLIKLYVRVRLFYTLKFINRDLKEQRKHKKKIMILQNK